MNPVAQTQGGCGACLLQPRCSKPRQVLPCCCQPHPVTCMKLCATVYFPPCSARCAPARRAPASPASRCTSRQAVFSSCAFAKVTVSSPAVASLPAAPVGGSAGNLPPPPSAAACALVRRACGKMAAWLVSPAAHRAAAPCPLHLVPAQGSIFHRIIPQVSLTRPCISPEHHPSLHHSCLWSAFPARTPTHCGTLLRTAAATPPCLANMLCNSCLPTHFMISRQTLHTFDR